MNYIYGSCDRSYDVRSVTIFNRKIEVVGEKLILDEKQVF